MSSSSTPESPSSSPSDPPPTKNPNPKIRPKQPHEISPAYEHLGGLYLFGVIAAPIMLLMPPRRLNLGSMFWSGLFCVSAQQLYAYGISQQRTPTAALAARNGNVAVGSTGVMGALGRAQIDGTDGAIVPVRKEKEALEGQERGRNDEDVQRGRRGEVGLISGASRVEDVREKVMGEGWENVRERGVERERERREGGGRGEGEEKGIRREDRGVMGMVRRTWRGDR